MTLTNLKDYKQNKKIKVVVSDLSAIIKIFDLSIKALKYYSKYAIVSEVISILASNKTILEIQHNKYKKVLETGE